MEIVLNDYSLNGQFETTEDFLLWINKECKKIFEYSTKQGIAIYKKSDFYSRKITEEVTMYDLLQRKGDPLLYLIRDFIINAAFSPPYWDDEGVQKTDIQNTYKCPFESDLPNCFSEAIERDKIILSIKHEEFLEKSYEFSKNGEGGQITNLVELNSFLCTLFEFPEVDIKYVFENFKFPRKIIFAEISGKCYAREAIEQNGLTIEDKKNILLNISELIRGLSNGTKNRFWDNLSDGIFEYRISVSAGREFRLFFVQDDAIIFLNGFIKKVEKTPLHEIEKAKKIKREFFS